MLSIIVPVLNEEDEVSSCLQHLKNNIDTEYEVIVVDGGSNDNTVENARKYCDQLLITDASRSKQMNAGASVAKGNILLFLHVDTVLPVKMEEFVEYCQLNKLVWGRFSIKLSGENWMFRIIESCMNIRSKLTGISTGDHAIFVNKALFERVNGYPELALMEDIALCKQLKNIIRPECLKYKVTSSSRRWEKHGIIRTILKMWLLRLLYFFQIDTFKLAKYYN